jgi:hypothetical protein
MDRGALRDASQRPLNVCRMPENPMNFGRSEEVGILRLRMIVFQTIIARSG